MFITADEAKKQLNIDAYYTADDEYICGLIDAAETAIARHIHRDLTDILDNGALPAPIRHAVLLLVSTWYMHRESVGAKTEILPHSYDYLCQLYQNYEAYG